MRRLAVPSSATRLASLSVAYAVCGPVSVRFVPPIAVFLHGHGTPSFDGLAPDQDTGPLGGTGDPLGFVGLHHTFFVIFMTPVVCLPDGPWSLYAASFVLGEALPISGPVSFITVGRHY